MIGKVAVGALDSIAVSPPIDVLPGDRLIVTITFTVSLPNGLVEVLLRLGALKWTVILLSLAVGIAYAVTSNHSASWFFFLTRSNYSPFLRAVISF